jgi:hypothetical protein
MRSTSMYVLISSSGSNPNHCGPQEELMEADLHAIVITRRPSSFSIYLARFLLDPIWPTPHGRPLPILPIPDPVWSEIHPLRQCPPSRS